MTDTLYEKTFPSTLESLAAVLPEALEALEEAGCFSPENRQCLHLCLEEGLVNAVTHGNEGDARRQVSVNIAADPRSVRICIRDEGGGFDLGAIATPEPAQHGGRGICLIKHFMDHVEYDREAKCLRMTLNRGKAARKECGSDGE